MSLAKYIHDYYDVEYDNPIFLYLYECSLKYLTKTISASVFHKRIKKVITSKSVKVFRLKLIENGYFLLNVKMFILHACSFKRFKTWNVEDKYEEFEILGKDKVYLKKFFYDKELNQHTKAITFQLGGKNKLPCLMYLKELCTKIILSADTKLKPLINNLVWTKLKFLIQSGSLDIETVKSEIKAKMVQTFYWLSPFKKSNIQHWVMSLIKPIKNHTINMINFHTTKKRVRMVEENGIYTVVEKSIDGMENEDKSKYFTDHGETHEQIENKLTVKQLLKRYGITERRIKAFKVMSGVYDEAFTSWLKNKGYIAPNSNMDNTDFQEQTSYSLFLKLVSKFVKMKWAYFKRLIQKLKFELENPVKEDINEYYLYYRTA
jgi:hypothetical protein